MDIPRLFHDLHVESRRRQIGLLAEIGPVWLAASAATINSSTDFGTRNYYRLQAFFANTEFEDNACC